MGDREGAHASMNLFTRLDPTPSGRTAHAGLDMNALFSALGKARPVTPFLISAPDATAAELP